MSKKLLYDTLFKKFALALAKKKGSNVVNIGPEIQELVNKEYIKYIKAFEKAGVDIDNLSPSDVKFTIELNEANKLRKKEGIEKALITTDNIVDMKGKKLDPNEPIIGGTQSDDVLQKSIKKNVEEATKKGDFQGIFNQVLRDPEIAKAFREEKAAEALANERALQKRPIPLDTIQYQGPDIQKMTGPEKQKYLITNDEQTAELLKKGYTFDDIIYAQDNYGLTAKEIMEEAKGATKKDPFPFQSGGRVGLKAGMSRRAFLKLIGGVGAGIGALKSGILKLTGTKGATVAKEVTSVPIKNIEGMPAWFKPLVNKVIKEGEDVTEKFAFKDRQIVHKTKLPDSGTDVAVTQDLDTGDVLVDIGLEKHGFASGKYGQPVRLEYKAAEIIEPDIDTAGKIKSRGGKTKEEFNVEEAEFTGGSPENVKFEDSSVNKFGEHESDFSEVEAFATGKRKKDARKVSESSDKQNEDVADLFSNYPEPDDFASGGIARVGYFLGSGRQAGTALIREILKYYNRDQKIRISEMLKTFNTRELRKLLDELSTYKKFDVKESGMPMPQILEDKIKKLNVGKERILESVLTAANAARKLETDLALRQNKMIEDAVNQGFDRQEAKELVEGMTTAVEKSTGGPPRFKTATDEGIMDIEMMLKDLKTQGDGRKLNASGGLAGMLGE